MFKYFAFCEIVQQQNIILSFLNSTWLILSFLNSTWLFILLDHLPEMFRLTMLGIYWNLLQPILKHLIFSYDIWNFDQWCVLFVDSFCLFVILRAGKFVTFVAKRMKNTLNFFIFFDRILLLDCVFMIQEFSVARSDSFQFALSVLLCSGWSLLSILHSHWLARRTWAICQQKNQHKVDCCEVDEIGF